MVFQLGGAGPLPPPTPGYAYVLKIRFVGYIREIQVLTYSVQEVTVLHFIITYILLLTPHSDRHDHVFALTTSKRLCLDPRISCYEP